jgi:peroxiredoxin
VQKWFDQGHTLLHSFWFYEAERAFRWCLKLEPENAMAWWGMARAAGDRERTRSFIKEAIKRKDKVSERERLYIEAWAALEEDPLRPADYKERQRRHVELLEHIVLKYPRDVEAKALLALSNEGGRLAADVLLKQVIAAEPMHPGAHHYRIHNWNYRESEQALDSCALYGKIAKGIGHAQHMPGHVYSTVGMWHEAAISMDAATRVEKQYMRTRMILPWDDWNYTHNANYLSYIQCQLGMASEAIRGARQLLAVAHDPKQNELDKFSTHWQGMLALMRALVKFERWDEILDSKTFPWGENARDKAYRAYVEALAHLGKKDPEKAEKSFASHKKHKESFDKGEYSWLKVTYEVQARELKGRLEAARGDMLAAVATLTDAAEREAKLREEQNDPPFYPVVVYNLLGQTYLSSKSPTLAVTAFHKALEGSRNDGFALAGLVEAYSALRETDKARNAMSRLLAVWSDADPGLKELERARSLVSDAKPKAETPAPERNYKTVSLAEFGPNLWEPYPAPALDAVDAKGKRVTLKDFQGKNVLLIFYLGEECVHCMQQLAEVKKKVIELAGLDTEVLAVSSAAREKNAAALKTADLPFPLLSDTNFENARRFKSYDDFENLELHSTILIDKRGRVHWARTGGDPFTDIAFLLKEIGRMNAMGATMN